MLVGVDPVPLSGANGLTAMIYNLAITAGVALINHLCDIRPSGTFRFPNVIEELSVHDARNNGIQSRWKLFHASLPPSATFKGIQTPTYQGSSEISGVAGLLSFVVLSIITGVLVLSMSSQAPPSVDTPSTANEALTSTPNQNQTSRRRDVTHVDSLTDSERVPPHGQSSDESSWVAKEQILQKNNIAQGGSPPPPPPPPSSLSVQDGKDGINKSDLDWISILLVFPILTLLLRRLLVGIRIVSGETPHSRNQKFLVNVLADSLDIVNQGLIPEETCPNLIPWSYSSCQTFDSLSAAGGLVSPLVAVSQPTTPAPLAIGSRRSIWNFCVDLATFVMGCALSCCAFLLYFSLGLDEEKEMHLGDRQQEAVIVDRIPNAAGEFWQNVEREDADHGLPGEGSMFLIIMDKSDKRQLRQPRVEPGSASTSTTVPFVSSPPSRADLNPMAKTFIPKQFQSLNSSHTLHPTTSSAPNTIEHKAPEVPDKLDGNSDTPITSGR